MAKAVKKKKELTLEEKLAEALLPVEEQPYQVPENWCWVRLKNLSEPICDGVHFAPSYIESGIPCYSAKDIYSDEIHNDKCFYITRSDYEDMKNKINVKQNSILVTKSGSIGRSAVVDDYYEFGLVESIGVINVLQGKPYYIKRLLDYGFVYSNTYLEQYTTGTTIKHLTLRLIEKILVPLPPLPEQQRIVDRIESLFAKLDEAKEKAQAVVDGFEDRKAAILHKAFTGELTKEWRKNRNIALDSWLTQSLKESCSIGSGGTPSRKNPEYYRGQIPWIKTGEIYWNEIYDSEEHISQNAVDNSSAKIYPAGAVLVAMYGMGVTRGRAAILKVKATTNQAVCVLQPKEYLLNRFLYYYFMCNYWDVREQAVGGNQLNLSGAIIAKFIISIPSIDEQNEITKTLDSLFEKEQQAKEAAEQVISQIDIMKKSILARAFRGELGTNDPADESAVELLKRIL